MLKISPAPTPSPDKRQNKAEKGKQSLFGAFGKCRRKTSEKGQPVTGLECLTGKYFKKTVYLIFYHLENFQWVFGAAQLNHFRISEVSCGDFFTMDILYLVTIYTTSWAKYVLTSFI